MDKLINNIELKDNYIKITYFNNSIKKINYNKDNRTKIINDLKKQKEYLEFKQNNNNFLNIIYTSILILNSLLITLNIIFSNNILLNIIIDSILLFINILIYIIKNNNNIELNNINNLLNIINSNEIPNEKKYLNRLIIYDIDDYLNYNNLFNNKTDEGKILNFKQK